ncbi:hypothetical protein A0H81_11431 [Grifola frondosa]|uniref:Uncharacterized protein n=1 Tax=Grifola frondosa TaxID=5627 RepID=A0A1C7LUU8_GRIFR|nr:hypothetical protein A0H81_11431 [Grifola frondosa]
MHTRVLLALQSQSQGSTASSAPFLALDDNNVHGQLATLALAGCTNSHGLHRDSLVCGSAAPLHASGSSQSGSRTS